jgi:hypothetical protein
VRADMKTRLGSCALIFSDTSCSAQFIGISGWNSPSGSCGIPAFGPAMPANFST